MKIIFEEKNLDEMSLTDFIGKDSKNYYILFLSKKKSLHVWTGRDPVWTAYDGIMNIAGDFISRIDITSYISVSNYIDTQNIVHMWAFHSRLDLYEQVAKELNRLGYKGIDHDTKEC